MMPARSPSMPGRFEFWVNIGVRVGWVSEQSKPELTSDERSGDQSGETPIGYAKVGSETIDPLLLQMIWLALAFGIGKLLQLSMSEVVAYFESLTEPAAAGSDAQQQLADRLTFASIVDSFPLFIYTLFGGLLVRLRLRNRLEIDFTRAEHDVATDATLDGQL